MPVARNQEDLQPLVLGALHLFWICCNLESKSMDDEGMTARLPLNQPHVTCRANDRTLNSEAQMRLHRLYVGWEKIFGHSEIALSLPMFRSSSHSFWSSLSANAETYANCVTISPFSIRSFVLYERSEICDRNVLARRYIGIQHGCLSSI